jgi:hypothetical protein
MALNVERYAGTSILRGEMPHREKTGNLLSAKPGKTRATNFSKWPQGHDSQAICRTTRTRRLEKII